MAVVALVCVGAGTWQIFRFQEKVHENDDLRANAKAAPTTVASLLPLVGSTADPSRARVEFRPVRVTGTYDASGQVLVRNRSLDAETGFLVLTPLRTDEGVVLVVRGFRPPTADGGVPRIPAPPAGRVTVLGRAHAAESRHDLAGTLPAA